MRTLTTVFVTILGLAVIGLAVILGGFYDVSASTPHTAVGRWIFHTTMENSVKRQAQSIQVPQLGEERAKEGAGHYAAMCEGCHGAPGVEPNEVGQALNPSPPDLADEAQDWNEAQLFWIIKHGVKMTGMPAWGESDSDEELWSVVAFLKTLPGMSATQYQELKARYGGVHEHGEMHGEHGHEGSGEDTAQTHTDEPHEAHTH